MSALSFFLAWLANPRRIGAIAPSSAALAEAITADLTPASAPVIELGPGTGVFTRSIIARGIPEHRLALIEYDAAFIDKLQRDFPRAHVHRLDATRLRHLELFDGEPAGAVVSGIPLLLMPAKKVIALLQGAFERLRPDGAFYQFTYGPDAPIRSPILDRLGLMATRIGGTLANVPPAAVYRLRRRPSPAVADATGALAGKSRESNACGVLRSRRRPLIAACSVAANCCFGGTSHSACSPYQNRRRRAEPLADEVGPLR